MMVVRDGEVKNLLIPEDEELVEVVIIIPQDMFMMEIVVLMVLKQT